MPKPDKILYENQENVRLKAVKFLKTFLKKYEVIQEAYIWASLAEGKFGIYKEPYRNQKGSDIDLVLILKENTKIPKEWNFTKVEKSWFDLYDLGYFKYKGNKHQIDGLIVIPEKHNLEKMKKDIEGRSKRIL